MLEKKERCLGRKDEYVNEEEITEIKIRVMVFLLAPIFIQ
jgi:hypothetical protein